MENLEGRDQDVHLGHFGEIIKKCYKSVLFQYLSDDVLHEMGDNSEVDTFQKCVSLARKFVIDACSEIEIETENELHDLK
jgi:hypothetical protein